MEGNMGQRQVYSTTDFMRLFIKIFGLIAIIFIGIAIVVPWASFSAGNYGVSLNAWGASTNVPEALVGSAGYTYLSDAFYINSMQSGITEGIVAGICMILVFIFTIITLLISIKAWRNIGMSGVNKMYLFAGIFAIVTMVLCVIAVGQANSFGNAVNAASGGTALPSGFGYTWGFILAIIAMIFFFINYGIDVYMLQSGMGLQKASSVQQPQMMYTSQQPPQQPPVQQPPAQQQPVQQTPPPQPPQQPKPTTAEVGFCPKCGAQMQAGVKFCPGCGAKI